MLKATAVPPRWTPMKLQMPDNTTAVRGRSDLRVNDRGDGIGRVVKAVDKLERQGKPQKQEKDQQPSSRRAFQERQASHT